MRVRVRDLEQTFLNIQEMTETEQGNEEIVARFHLFFLIETQKLAQAWEHAFMPK